MYRIRLVTGQEQVYPSIQDLTAGVQRGEVTADAEIYHQRSDRWLSIESHPHYRMALEGGTATRTSRLKFTRPSSPASTSGVLPTPVAQKPDQGDLEELNRLLVLLDPLPTPAQRADPEPQPAHSPPELTLVRPEPMGQPMASDDPEPVFGTMLRLEDLELAPVAEPDDAEILSMEVIRDARVLSDQAEAVEEAAPPVEASEEPIEVIAPSDLGLPIEIHLDEIPVPLEAEPVAAAEAVAEADALALEEDLPPVDEEPVADAVPFAVAALTPTVEFGTVAQSEEAAQAAVPSRRRFSPMLYVAAAAIVAAAIFAFTSGGSDAEQSMVTLASATAPATAAAPLTSIDSSLAAPTPAASGVGFPVPATSTASSPATPPRDSGVSGGVLPSAPQIDLPSGGAAEVSAGTAATRDHSGAGAELAKGYSRAYALLDGDFSTQMDRSGLVRLFSQTQLTTSDGLAGARRALDAAATAVRQYHVREGAIEKAYQDSARALERNGASASDLRDWITHVSLKESKEAADEGARLIGQIDAVFALLQAQSGRYRIDGATVRFDNADAGARYAELQGWITRRLEHWAGQPASSVPTTVRPLLEGIGLTRLPTSR